MTSLPSRLAGVCPALQSIAVQTRRPDRLILSLPRRSEREGRAYELPPALLALMATEPWIQVHWLDWDVGPGTKILGLLDWLRTKAGKPHAGDVLMVLDDDHEYAPYALAELLSEQHTRGPGHVVTYFAYFFRGLMVPQGADIIACQPCDGLADALPAYHQAFVAGDRACFLVDDLWISFFLFLCGSSVTSLRELVMARGLKTIYRQTANAKVAALQTLDGEDRRDRVMLRGFEALLQRLLAAGPQGLALYGGAAAMQRLKRLEAEVRQAEARIMQLSTWVARERSVAGARGSAQAVKEVEAELAKWRHLYELQAPMQTPVRSEMSVLKVPGAGQGAA